MTDGVYRILNADKIAARNKEWYKENKERANNNTRKAHYLNEYGITLENIELMLKNQDDKCLICKEEIILSGAAGAQIDHCHNSNIIRGILCRSCNIGLGNFKDNITMLFNAINYLRDFKKKQFTLITNPIKESISKIKKSFINPFEKAVS